jgi:hypothetical protein
MSNLDVDWLGPTHWDERKELKFAWIKSDKRGGLFRAFLSLGRERCQCMESLGGGMQELW